MLPRWHKLQVLGGLTGYVCVGSGFDIHDGASVTCTSFLFFCIYHSAVAQADRSTWVTRQPLLDEDSIGRPLHTLPEKVEVKVWSAKTKTLIALVSKNAVATGA